MKKQKGLGLVGILIIVCVLIITVGGVVVWEKKVLPKPNPELTPPAREITVTPPPSEVGSEEYCHQFRHDNCPLECQVGPSCPICQDIGCHAKGTHRVQTNISKLDWNTTVGFMGG